MEYIIRSIVIGKVLSVHVALLVNGRKILINTEEIRTVKLKVIDLIHMRNMIQVIYLITGNVRFLPMGEEDNYNSREYHG